MIIDRDELVMETRTVGDLIEQVHGRTGLSLYDSKLAVDMTFTLIKEGLLDRKRYFIRGFATFDLKKRMERTGRDFEQHKTIRIPKCYTPIVEMSDVFIKKIRKKITLPE